MFWATAVPLTLMIVGIGLVFTGEFQLLRKGLSSLWRGKAREVVVVRGGKRQENYYYDDDNDSDHESKAILRETIALLEEELRHERHKRNAR